MFYKFLFLVLFFSAGISAQDFSDSLYKTMNFTDSVNNIRNAYKSFNYVEVIKKSVDILLRKNEIPQHDLIEIYLLKGSSHFALQEDTLAKYSFLEILKIDTSYTPDSVSISPKIVRFFNQVKDTYNFPPGDESEIEVPDDSLKWLNYYNNVYDEQVSLFKSSLYRSLLFPGLGHLYAGDAKGWYLTAASVVSFASSVFFIIRTNDKRSEYLHAYEPSDIQQKYKDYNEAFKIRNISYAVFGAVWIFSQFDIISSLLSIPEPQNIDIQISPGEMNFSFRIHL